MDGSRKIRCQLEDVIVREALSVSNDSSLWRTITYLLVPEYIKRVDVKMIPKVVSLAMAILIVGTEEKDLLPHAFELLRYNCNGIINYYNYSYSYIFDKVLGIIWGSIPGRARGIGEACWHRTDRVR